MFSQDSSINNISGSAFSGSFIVIVVNGLGFFSELCLAGESSQPPTGGILLLYDLHSIYFIVWFDKVDLYTWLASSINTLSNPILPHQCH